MTGEQHCPLNDKHQRGTLLYESCKNARWTL
jgi:hypothetical protein